MRIVDCIQALIAVLSFTAFFQQVNSQKYFNDTLRGPRTARSARRRHSHEDWYGDSKYSHEIRLPQAGKYLSPRENQLLLRQEIRNRTEVDCCPSVLEMIEPEGGKNQDDQYVELYRDGDYRQRFYELSCHQDILGKPCRFMDKKLHEHSRCVQKYSFTYALVKDPGGRRANKFPTIPSAGPGTWALDYIRVRSGCGCVVTPAKRKRDKAKHKRKKAED